MIHLRKKLFNSKKTEEADDDNDSLYFILEPVQAHYRKDINVDDARNVFCADLSS